MRVSALFIAIFSAAIIWLSPNFTVANSGEKALINSIARANDLYLKKNYDEAVKIYEEIIGQGVINGYLFYNLGNTYIRLEKSGLAIMNFLRARQLLPRDRSVDANLRYAIGTTVDQISPRPSGFLNSLVFWADDFNLTEHLRMLILVNLMFWTAMTGWYYYRNSFWNTARKVFFLLLLLALISAGTRIHGLSQNENGVILANRVDIKSGQDTENVTLFQLHEGAVVPIIKREGNWILIDLGDEKKGWVPKHYLGSVKIPL